MPFNISRSVLYVLTHAKFCDVAGLSKSSVATKIPKIASQKMPWTTQKKNAKKKKGGKGMTVAVMKIKLHALELSMKGLRHALQARLDAGIYWFPDYSCKFDCN